MTEDSASYNRVWVPAFLLNSVPKAGTHLLEKAVALFPGVEPTRMALHAMKADRFQDGGGGETVPLGVAAPRPVSLRRVRRFLEQVGTGCFVKGHVPFSRPMADLLAELGMRTVLILRDPRDVVVSHVQHALRKNRQPLHEYFQSLPPSERLMRSILGVEKTGPDGWEYRDIDSRCRAVLPWTAHDFNFTTRFETLVGPQGGGATRAEQEAEVARLARHLGLRHTPEELGRVVDGLFGGTSTFDRGLVGGWKEHFGPEHRAAFKKVAGPLLVELGYERDENW